MDKTRFILSILGVSFILLGLSNCRGGKTDNDIYSFNQNPPFGILEVYSQDWIAGIKGGGSGTNLFIIITELKEKVEIKDIYFRNKIINAQKDHNNSLLYLGYFKKENNRDIIMDSDPIKEAQNTPPKIFPFQLKENEAVISYLYEEELQFYKVSNIMEKDIIAYPETKPKIDG